MLSAGAAETLRSSTLFSAESGPPPAAITVVPGPIRAVRPSAGLVPKPDHEDHDADDVDERGPVAGGRTSQGASQFTFPSTAGTANISPANRGPDTVLTRFVQADEPWADAVEVHGTPAPVGPAPARTEAPAGAAEVVRAHATSTAVEFSAVPVVPPGQISPTENVVRDVVMPFIATESMIVAAMVRDPNVSLATAETVALPVIRSLRSAVLFNDALTRFAGQCSSIVGSAITPDGALPAPHRRAWAITGGTVLLDLAVAAWLVRRSRQKGRRRTRRDVPCRFILASVTPYGLRR
jgi:hypothetical protein